MTEREEQFIKVWNESESALEASQKLNLTYGSARQMALMYRKKGYTLKKFKTGPRSKDVAK